MVRVTARYRNDITSIRSSRRRYVALHIAASRNHQSLGGVSRGQDRLGSLLSLLARPRTSALGLQVKQAHHKT